MYIDARKIFFLIEQIQICTSTFCSQKILIVRQIIVVHLAVPMAYNFHSTDFFVFLQIFGNTASKKIETKKIFSKKWFSLPVEKNLPKAKTDFLPYGNLNIANLFTLFLISI